MLKLGFSADQRNVTNSSASKLCERLSDIAARSFPDKMADSHVFLTSGQDAGIRLRINLLSASGIDLEYLGRSFLEVTTSRKSSLSGIATMEARSYQRR
jgi:hypothetical protein